MQDQHIAQLIDAGFLRDAGVRKGERNLERLVDTVADDFVIDFKDHTGHRSLQRAFATTAGRLLRGRRRSLRSLDPSTRRTR